MDIETYKARMKGLAFAKQAISDKMDELTNKFWHSTPWDKPAGTAARDTLLAIAQVDKIQAIKFYRTRWTCSIKEAHEYINSLLDNAAE